VLSLNVIVNKPFPSKGFSGFIRKLIRMGWYRYFIRTASAFTSSIRPDQTGVESCYIFGPTFPIKDQLSRMGFRFDRDTKGWYIATSALSRNQNSLTTLQQMGIPIPAMPINRPPTAPAGQIQMKTQQPPVQQPQTPKTYILGKAKNLQNVEPGSPVVLSQNGPNWDWITQDGITGVIPTSNVANAVESIRDQSGKVYKSNDPSELFAAFAALNQPAPEMQPLTPNVPGPVDEAKRAKAIIPEEKMSVEQKSVEKDFATGKGNIGINALAGSGKTSIMNHLAWKYGKPNEQWLYLVFNTKNKVEAKTKFPEFVHVATTNGFLGKIISDKSNIGKLPYTKRMVDISNGNKKEKVPEKTRLILDGPEMTKMLNGYRIPNPALLNEAQFDRYEFAALKSILGGIRRTFKMETDKLCGLAKSYAVDPRKKETLRQSIKLVADKYDIDFGMIDIKEKITKYKDRFQTAIRAHLGRILGYDFMSKSYEREMIEATEWLLAQSLPQGTSQIYDHKGVKHNLGDYRDFADDLWYAAIFADQLNWPTFNFALADEVQDFNMCQQIALKKIAEKKAKVMAVGDPNQSLYRFRGADADAFESLMKSLGGKEHSLSFNFRSRPAIIDFVNKKTHVKNLKRGMKIPEKDLQYFLQHFQSSTTGPEYMADIQTKFPGPNGIDLKAWKLACDNGEIEWPPTARGEVTEETLDYDGTFESLKQERKNTNKIKQTAFICRTNAPLVHAALKLLGEGLPFVIAGKDIAGELIKHIQEVMYARVKSAKHLDKMDINSALSDFSQKLSAYLDENIEIHGNKAARQAELKDLSEITQAIQSCLDQFDPHGSGSAPAQVNPGIDPNNADEMEVPPVQDAWRTQPAVKNIGQFQQWLETKLKGLDIGGSGAAAEADIKKYMEVVEGNKENAPIVLSSSHLSKGLEFLRVFVLRNDQFPHPMAKRPEDLKQEANAHYVTLTRAMDELHILKLDGQPGYKGK
jgi:hypothetical protein